MQSKTCVVLYYKHFHKNTIDNAIDILSNEKDLFGEYLTLNAEHEANDSALVKKSRDMFFGYLADPECAIPKILLDGLYYHFFCSLSTFFSKAGS
jgi:hypothetical protein